MPASPICEVKDGAGLWVSTTDGVDVTPGNTISIRLGDATDVVEWYLRIFGTDELLPIPPTLTDVNALTHKVTSPSTVVTFTAPGTTGHALVFESVIVTSLQTLSTTFGVYELADNGLRVGAVMETREGSADFGWAKMVNEAIRTIGSGFTAGGDLSGTASSQTVIGLQGRTLAATAPTDGQAIVWNNGLSQWEPGAGGGGSITLGGDLGPWTPPGDDHQRVVGIDTIPAPLSDTVDAGLFVRAALDWEVTSPRPVIIDGDDLWVAEHDQSATHYSLVRRISLLDNSLVAVITLPADIPSGVRDLAQDANYVYVAGWYNGQVAIIEKSSNTIVGYGSLTDFGESGRQVTSVAADGAGNFYAIGWGYSGFSRTYGIFKWPTAACLGAAVDTVAPSVAVYNSDYAYIRKIRFGLGYLWVAGGYSGMATLRKFDSSLSEVAASVNTDFGMNVALYGSNIYVPERDGDTLIKYDTDCVVVDSVSVAALTNPDGLAFDDQGTGRLLLTSTFGSSALLIDSATMTILDTFSPLPESSWGEMVSYNGDFILAAFVGGGV